jgi:hypothetical protein
MYSWCKNCNHCLVGFHGPWFKETSCTRYRLTLVWGRSEILGKVILVFECSVLNYRKKHAVDYASRRIELMEWGSLGGQPIVRELLNGNFDLADSRRGHRTAESVEELCPAIEASRWLNLQCVQKIPREQMPTRIEGRSRPERLEIMQQRPTGQPSDSASCGVRWNWGVLKGCS